MSDENFFRFVATGLCNVGGYLIISGIAIRIMIWFTE